MVAQRLGALAALFFVAQSIALECTVKSVHDGDTLTAQCGADKLRVRLTEIDAPERTQPYSRLSANSLKEICVGKPAKMRIQSTDKYGRTLARVICDGTDANAEQVRRGYAWAYDKYLTDPAIKALETEARKAGRGLWRSANPQPPWEFRHPTGK